MTALQQLYEEIEYTEKNSHTGLVSIIDLKRAIGNYYLEKEKQQIIDAWHNGWDNQSPMIDEGNCGQTYYKQTYNQPKQ